MRDADFVKVAKALADPTRFRMLQEIRGKGSLNCTQLCGCFPLSQPTISHHVKTLEAAGLLAVRKEGQYHVLTANEPRLAAFMAAIDGHEPITSNAPQTDATPAPAKAPRKPRPAAAARKPRKSGV
jgi:ArsR family transcriptional regulator, arsenate/arsenite/antimonite-responsive transcriptional repressor